MEKTCKIGKYGKVAVGIPNGGGRDTAAEGEGKAATTNRSWKKFDEMVKMEEILVDKI